MKNRGETNGRLRTTVECGDNDVVTAIEHRWGIRVLVVDADASAVSTPGLSERCIPDGDGHIVST